MFTRGNITIRPARAEDAAAIAAVLRDVGWFAHINDEAPTATESRVSGQLALNADGDSHTVLVAVDANGVVAGYIAVHWFPNLMKGADGYVSELFLREAARGQGIGSTLLDAVKAEAVRRGVNRLMLFNHYKSGAEVCNLFWYLGWYVVVILTTNIPTPCPLVASKAKHDTLQAPSQRDHTALLEAAFGPLDTDSGWIVVESALGTPTKSRLLRSLGRRPREHSEEHRAAVRRGR